MRKNQAVKQKSSILSNTIGFVLFSKYSFACFFNTIFLITSYREVYTGINYM